MNQDGDDEFDQIEAYQNVYLLGRFDYVPLNGIADYKNAPHSFNLTFDYVSDDYSDIYTLDPISRELVALAVERVHLYLAWRKLEPSPMALPGPQDAYYAALSERVKLGLERAAVPRHRIRARAQFSPRPTRRSYMKPDIIKVRWSLVSEPG